MNTPITMLSATAEVARAFTPGSHGTTFGGHPVSCAAALAEAGPEDAVIAADTVVYLDGLLLGKPRDPAEAAAMLSRLSGRTHTVCTGVAVAFRGGTRTLCQQTRVTFYDLSRGLIDWYVSTGEPMDKAGAYGIQGYGALLVEGIEGDYCNVVGLPVCRLGRMLARFGVDALALCAQKEQTP